MECGLIDHIAVLFANNPEAQVCALLLCSISCYGGWQGIVNVSFQVSSPPSLHVQRVDQIIVTHVCVWKRTMYCIGSTFQSPSWVDVEIPTSRVCSLQREWVTKFCYNMLQSGQKDTKDGAGHSFPAKHKTQNTNKTKTQPSQHRSSSRIFCYNTCRVACWVDRKLSLNY